MVYDLSKSGGTKRVRKTVKGKLVGLTTNAEKCKVYDDEIGKYSFIQLSLILGKNEAGEDIWFNATAFKIDMREMPELAKADTLVAAKTHPLVQFEYYETDPRLAVDEHGLPKFDTVDKEDAKGNKFVQKEPRMYINNRLSPDDVKNSFKIIIEDAEPDKKVEAKPVPKGTGNPLKPFPVKEEDETIVEEVFNAG